MELNPQHPIWYRGVLSLKEYAKGNYHAAVDEAVKANAPYLFWLQVILAAAHGQLGEQAGAAAAIRAISEQVPGFAANARAIGGTWLQSDVLEHLLQGTGEGRHIANRLVAAQDPYGVQP